jgi:signal recognition particle subunit SRP54
MMRPAFDLNDFRKQVVRMTQMDSFRELVGMSRHANAGEKIEIDLESKRIQGIIDSMTLAERSRPELIDTSRRCRIAAGAGVEPSDVSNLVKQFDAMAAMVQQMSMLDRN